jgi:hypothetical protein
MKPISCSIRTPDDIAELLRGHMGILGTDATGTMGDAAPAPGDTLLYIPSSAVPAMVAHLVREMERGRE